MRDYSAYLKNPRLNAHRHVARRSSFLRSENARDDDASSFFYAWDALRRRYVDRNAKVLLLLRNFVARTSLQFARVRYTHIVYTIKFEFLWTSKIFRDWTNSFVTPRLCDRKWEWLCDGVTSAFIVRAVISHWFPEYQNAYRRAGEYRNTSLNDIRVFSRDDRITNYPRVRIFIAHFTQSMYRDFSRLL